MLTTFLEKLNFIFNIIINHKSEFSLSFSKELYNDCNL